MSKLRIGLVLAVTLLIGACANINSIYRPLDLTATSVAVDAKQRGIYSTMMKPGLGESGDPQGFAVLCAEPSPDALSAYASSGGLTALIQSMTDGSSAPKSQAQAAFAAGESSASIGLRTQSIQLLRDGLFANCLAYMNRAVTSDQYFQLQRRSQNFTLGLLAIEQLTGAVKADQATLSFLTGAATGNDDVTEQQGSVDEAEKAVIASQEALERSRNRVKEAEEEERDSAIKLVSAEEAQKNADAGVSPEAKSKLASAVVDAKAELRNKHEATTNRTLEAQTNSRILAANQRRLETANAQLTLALGRVKAFANGTAELAAAQSRAMVADHISKAVAKIVDNVLDHSGIEEACLTVLGGFSLTSKKELDRQVALASILCAKPQRQAASKLAESIDPDKRKENNRVLRVD